MMTGITVAGLTKVYRTAFSKKRVLALDGLDLTVAPGEIFGLLGPNGAGKTTLLKILLSVVRPTSGAAQLNGIPVNRPEARRHIGFLPENHRFPDFLTPDQMLDLYGRMAGVSAADRKQRVPELLEMVNMTEWHDTKIKKFSKGMMQRVGLAQALVNDPEIVFLDEPTDGVDPIGRREIRDVLLRLKDQGKTIFLNSHLLSEVEHMCTRVAILKKGRKVREGNVEELTRVETHFDVRTAPVSEPILSRLSERFTFDINAASADSNNFRLNNADRAMLNAWIDALRAAGIDIEEVHPVRQSLEERFVQEVGDSS